MSKITYFSIPLINIKIKELFLHTCVLSGIGTDKIGKVLVGAVTVKGGNHGAPVQTASTAGGSVFALSLLACSLRAPKIECSCSK